MTEYSDFFKVDQLSIIMISIVGFVALSVAFFSSRYLKGDGQYRGFYLRLLGLFLSVCIMVSADHILLFLLAWISSNSILTKLMIHKSSWEAAYQSGMLGAKNFIVGFGMICFAVALLYRTSGTTSISAMVAFHYPAATLVPSLVCLLIAAMTQSAIWPFQGWLLSSLNAPTPISALMHAGLVNGGGFLLARFAALYFKSPLLLTVIFTVGLITALLGTLWKLMQSDVKRMLACSTMAQMGFMIVQCGLGLFPTAVAHLCWHGLFKAYLFLASGSAAQEKRFDLGYPPRGSVFIGSLLCGLFGSMIFALASHKSVFSQDTTLLLILIAWISGSQFAIPILSQGLCKHFPLALLGTGFVSGLYGLSVYLITQFMTPLHLMHPQPLNIVHILGFILMFLAWLTLLLGHSFFSNKKIPAWILKMYVIMLNASQPNPKTVTSDRNSYHYL